MSARAIIVGVNEYPDEARTLSSAVNDAIEYRDALLGTGLVTEREVTLLTAPVLPHSELANRANIRAALREVYDRGRSLDWLFFFFSGHGLTVQMDVEHTVLHTGIMPCNVAGLDAEHMIDVDELCQKFRFAGPQNQLFVVDACRNLAFGERPTRLAPISWPAPIEATDRENRQAILYAVAPFGEARADLDGLGVMTQHLVRGLASAIAVDPSGRDWVVTPESLASYVRAHVERATAPKEGWRRSVMLPHLVHPTGSRPGAIRTLTSVPKRTLTLHFVPESAAAEVEVYLTNPGGRLIEPCWPPHGHAEAVAVNPTHFGIDPRPNDRAVAEPDRIDARIDDRVVIRAVEEVPAPSAPVEAGPGPARTRDLGRFRKPGDADQSATLRAYPAEPESVVEVEGLSPPYRSWRRQGNFQEHVPAGSYQVRFRVGDDVYSTSDVDVMAGHNVVVRATAAASPLLAEVLGAATVREGVTLSDELAGLQAEPLVTTLSLLAVRPFDQTGDVLPDPRWETPSSRVPPHRPLSIVVAAEGRWTPSPAEALRRVRCMVEGHGISLLPISDSEYGLGRILQHIGEAPRRAFIAEFKLPDGRSIDVPAASLDDRVTVLVLVLRPSGRVEIAQHLLSVPGAPIVGPRTDRSYDRVVRDLVLAQRLHASGELLERGRATDIRDLLYAKWTDPLVGCMGVHAWLDSGEARDQAQAAARNLLQWFGDLTDTNVAAALALSEAWRLEELLDSREVPVLARSVRELARYADTLGRVGTEPQRWTQRLAPGATWAVGSAAIGTTTVAQDEGVLQA